MTGVDLPVGVLVAVGEGFGVGVAFAVPVGVGLAVGVGADVGGPLLGSEVSGKPCNALLTASVVGGVPDWMAIVATVTVGCAWPLTGLRVKSSKMTFAVNVLFGLACPNFCMRDLISFVHWYQCVDSDAPRWFDCLRRQRYCPAQFAPKRN